MKKSIKVLFVTLVALISVTIASAQVTTSTINGKITDAAGEALPGAAVIAVHTPSGTTYYSVANADGRYSINGMRPGGPYEIKVNLLGYQTVVYYDVTLQLGETYKQDAALSESMNELSEAVLVASTTKFTTEKTGASTNISNREIMNLPTTSRGIGNLTKLSPYAGGSMSFAGSDGRSTNFTIDGANFNNNFGLSSNLPGGGSPISIDAIEEVQIVVAPYDVRQSNFVGGGVNAVTKSGTNTLKGSAYTYYTNQDYRGNSVAGEDLGERKQEYDLTYGFTLGGPIIKDKLFFFANFEMSKKPEQVIKYTPDAEAAAKLDLVAKKLRDDYGYEPGSYTEFPGDITNMKVLARLDWNISDAHKFSFRYNLTKNANWFAPNGNSCDDNFRNKQYNRSSETSFPFANNMYSQQNDVTSFAAELNSRFGSNAHNQIVATYTFINDQRGSNSAPFPHIDIMTGDTSSGNYIPFTSAGYELFTWNNGVINKVFNLADNFTYYAGAHKITAGASYEWQTARNSYMRNGTGYYRFASVEDFLNDATPLSFAVTYGYDGNENPAGVVTYSQIGLYAQDEWSVSDNLKLNYGIRADGLFFDNSDLMRNNAIYDYQMGENRVDTGSWPKSRVQISPRVGFNWDVLGDRKIVVRGGTGLFQGRLPLVFFTNMPQNSGMIQYSANKGDLSNKLNSDGTLKNDPTFIANMDKLRNPNGKGYITNVNDMVKVLGLPTTISPEDGQMQSPINGVDTNFKMPQIWKTSLAVDYQLPVDFPLTVTAEGMFNKTINGVRLVDWNVDASKLTDKFAGADSRVKYPSAFKYGGTTAYVLTNTNEGYGYTANLTINATPVKNLNIMAAYTHTESLEISGMPGSNATSAYENLYTVDGPNFATLHRSQYVVPDKFMANVSYFMPWSLFHGKGLHVNLYYSGYSAGTYSYTYSNDMNGDGIASDLMYIPASKDEIAFKTPADADAFWAFLEQDKYLSAHKGEYAKAYSASAPMVHRFDLRIAEDFAVKVGNTVHNLELSASFDNIGNMINDSWGVRKFSCYETSATYLVSPLKYEGLNDAGKPTFSMNKIGSGDNAKYPTETFDHFYKHTSQCWSVLFGVKYTF